MIQVLKVIPRQVCTRFPEKKVTSAVVVAAAAAAAGCGAGRRERAETHRGSRTIEQKRHRKER